MLNPLYKNKEPIKSKIFDEKIRNLARDSLKTVLLEKKKWFSLIFYFISFFSSYGSKSICMTLFGYFDLQNVFFFKLLIFFKRILSLKQVFSYQCCLPEDLSFKKLSSIKILIWSHFLRMRMRVLKFCFLSKFLIKFENFVAKVKYFCY